MNICQIQNCQQFYLYVHLNNFNVVISIFICIITIKVMQDFLAHGQSLSEYKVEEPQVIFRQASNYPDFFDEYLKDSGRIINIFVDDPNANQRIFYYQYLKLCYDAQIKDAKVLIQNVRDLIFNADFYFVFDLNTKQSSDHQCKRLIFEFMEIVEERKAPYTELLSSYPIIDRVFVLMLRSLLYFYGKAQSVDQQVDRQVAFTTFEQIFGLSIHKYGNCIKFVDADVFVYQDNPNQVYMAYIVGDQCPQQQLHHQYKKQYQKFEEQLRQDIISCSDGNLEDNLIQQTIQIQVKNPCNQMDHENERQNRKKNQIYISQASSLYDFVDYTSPEEDKKQHGQKNCNALDISEKNSANYFQKKSIENSSQLGLKKPFQEAKEKKKMASSDIQIKNKQQCFQRTSTDNNFFNGTKIQQKNIKYSQISQTQSTIQQKKDSMIMDTFQFNKQKTPPSNVFQDYIDNIKPVVANNRKIQEIPIYNKKQKQYKSNHHQPWQKMEVFTPKYQAPSPTLMQNSKSQQYITKQVFPNSSTKQHSSQTYKNIEAIIQTGELGYRPNKMNIISGKYRLTLNITKQFTNSAILNILPSIQNGNIRQARQRARMYRNSIRHLL